MGKNVVNVHRFDVPFDFFNVRTIEMRKRCVFHTLKGLFFSLSFWSTIFLTLSNGVVGESTDD